MKHDPTLVVGFEGAAAALDTSARAWVIVVGRLVDLEPRGPFTEAEMTTLIDAATDSGEFPSGPLAYAPEHEEYEVNPDYHMLTVRAKHNGKPYLESKIAFGIAGFLAQGFTRSGRLDESDEVHPSHVLLIDFEAVLAETIVLLDRAATMLGYVGPGRLMAGIVTQVPDQPLRLRALDEDTGGLAAPGRPLEEFEPVTLELDMGGTRAEAHRRVYDALLDIVSRFGADEPQFFTDPKRGTSEPRF